MRRPSLPLPRPAGPRLLAALPFLAAVDAVARPFLAADDDAHLQRGLLPHGVAAQLLLAPAPAPRNATQPLRKTRPQRALEQLLNGTESHDVRWYRLWIPANAAGFEELEVYGGRGRGHAHNLASYRSSSQYNPFRSSKVRRWKVHRTPPESRRLFLRAEAFSWVLFVAFIIAYLSLHMYLYDWPSTRVYHGVALVIWLAAALLYFVIIRAWFGAASGSTWLVGYLLEFVFSLENIFVYHIVIAAFKTPRKPAQKALFVVIVCQIVFQMGLFMGLASWLRSLHALPCLLGLWLVYVGFKTWNENEDEDFKIEDSFMFQVLKKGLGDSLMLKYEGDRIFAVDGNGKACVTMLGPVICCLLVVDLLMEVDVTLTKIEEIQSHYMAFTSSVAAAFAVPELFFVARDMFRRYENLKYGVCFAILYFGAELLLHDVVHISDMVGLSFIAWVMVICIVTSSPRKKHAPDESDLEKPPARGAPEASPPRARKWVEDPLPAAEGAVGAAPPVSLPGFHEHCTSS